MYTLLWQKELIKMNPNKPFMKSFEAEIIAEPVVPEIEDLEEGDFQPKRSFRWSGCGIGIRAAGVIAPRLCVTSNFLSSLS